MINVTLNHLLSLHEPIHTSVLWRCHICDQYCDHCTSHVARIIVGNLHIHWGHVRTSKSSRFEVSIQIDQYMISARVSVRDFCHLFCELDQHQITTWSTTHSISLEEIFPIVQQWVSLEWLLTLHNDTCQLALLGYK